MSTQYVEYPAVPAPRTFSWSGIFAGTFLFLAIEATFGILGVAIFGTIHPGAPVVPIIGVGIGIWMVILSIIALYFGGKLASKLSGAFNRNLGMYAGLPSASTDGSGSSVSEPGSLNSIRAWSGRLALSTWFGGRAGSHTASMNRRGRAATAWCWS